METRHLKGLGADGSLVFDDDPYPRWHRWGQALTSSPISSIASLLSWAYFGDISPINIYLMHVHIRQDGARNSGSQSILYSTRDQPHDTGGFCVQPWLRNYVEHTGSDWPLDPRNHLVLHTAAPNFAPVWTPQMNAGDFQRRWLLRIRSSAEAFNQRTRFFSLFLSCYRGLLASVNARALIVSASARHQNLLHTPLSHGSVVLLQSVQAYPCILTIVEISLCALCFGKIIRSIEELLWQLSAWAWSLISSCGSPQRSRPCSARHLSEQTIIVSHRSLSSSVINVPHLCVYSNIY